MNLRHPTRRLQHGIAAVELAIIMSATLVLLVPTAVIARAIWQYTAFKHATYNAARFMAASAPAEMAPNVAVAKQMVVDEMVANGVISASDMTTVKTHLTIFCSLPDFGDCSSGKTETIQVSGYILVPNPAGLSFSGARDWQLGAATTVRYRNGEQ